VTHVEIENALRAVLEAQHTAALVGILADSDDRSEWRAAVHEAGHALVLLVHGVDFDLIRIETTDTGAGGRIEMPPQTRRLQNRTTMDERIDGDVAGPIGEETILGDVEPLGVETDLRVALARGCVVHPENPTQANEDGIQWVRASVVRVRAMLRRRRRSLERLARELLRAKTLTRRDCVRIVRGRVRSRPFKSPTVPWKELHDCDVARDYLARRASELQLP
jgi:ATP-dependent Zn protease